MTMTFRIPKHRKYKAIIGKGKTYDMGLSAILYFLWRAGQLKAYPLNEDEYPDNADTETVMTIEMLKLKLRRECEHIPSFQNRICKK